MFIEKDDVAMDLMTAGESGSGLGSILDFCAGAAALLLGFVIAAALPPVTLAVLRKKYNQADGTPDRSAKEMLHAHKGAAKLCILNIGFCLLLSYLTAPVLLELIFVSYLYQK